MYATQQNIIQSPLLRLPAEIRNQIWTYAYSHLVIHPIRVPYSRTREVRYATCRQSDIIQNRYTWTVQGKNLEGFDPNLGRDIVAGPRFSCDCSLYIPSKKSKPKFSLLSQPKIPPAFAMPLVCKQFYYEASHVIFSTGIFSFKDSRNLVAFASSPESQVPNVQQISLEWLNTELWSATALSHDVLKRFRSLQGYIYTQTYKDVTANHGSTT
ncbi:hypothetical protein BCR34DRAFT_585781 [Clohesyomyces aquaticus]|uniref:DUF7730 domain-containing protein n=1 Tax=Clohesyomyces aquaticus TaxID=1231657 RepID=A0A1Y1ZWD4_9PLEO|nr:hypothetical protein BCR34DRAFT_585781 [Clohesyomyces aquaticus]